MKVLKHGSNFKPKKEKAPKIITCKRCGCEFQYCDDDVQHWENRINAYETDDYYRVACPECGQYHNVSDPRISD